MKKFLFGLIATAFLGLSANAQSTVTPDGYFKLDRVGFGRISSYAGPCVTGPGLCSGSVVNDESFFAAAISKINDRLVSFAFSKEFYGENLQYLQNGLNIGVSFSLPQGVSSRIGISGEFAVGPGHYAVTEVGGIYFVSLPRR